MARKSGTDDRSNNPAPPLPLSSTSPFRFRPRTANPKLQAPNPKQAPRGEDGRNHGSRRELCPCALHSAARTPYPPCGRFAPSPRPALSASAVCGSAARMCGKAPPSRERAHPFLPFSPRGCAEKATHGNARPPGPAARLRHRDRGLTCRASLLCRPYGTHLPLRPGLFPVLKDWAFVVRSLRDQGHSQAERLFRPARLASRCVAPLLSSIQLITNS